MESDKARRGRKEKKEKRSGLIAPDQAWGKKTVVETELRQHSYKHGLQLRRAHTRNLTYKKHAKGKPRRH